MGRFSGSALQNWQQQSENPAAPAGLQQGAQAAGGSGQGGRFSDSALGSWIKEDGYVGAAQSWYTGANQQGTANGWDNGFAEAFINGQNRAAEQGTMNTYFEQDDVTGVVTWDHKSSDGTQKFRFGDVYEDGKQVGNVFDLFGKETGSLMMSEWVFGADEKAKMFEDVTVDQATGKITDDGGMVQRVFEMRAENNEKIPQQLKALDFQADVKDRATEYREGYGDEAITAGGTAGGAALGAGIGTVILPGVGTVVGGVIGGIGGYFGASENTDALVEQAARASVITEISSRENGEAAGFFTGVSQWSGFASKLISPGSNLVQGFYDRKKGDGVADFYRTDSSGESTTPTWVKVADVGASIGDMALQFASPVGAAAFTAQMTGQIGGEVGELAATGGESFDYRRGGFDNIFTDEQGDFDASSAAAGIGKVGIDAVQLGMARGLLGRVQSARVLAGEEAVGQAPGLLGRIGQRLYGGSGAARREAGFKFTMNSAGEATGKRATLSLLAPSEQLSALGARVRAARASARSEGAYAVDDFYRAAVSMSHGDRKITNAIVNGMGEAYEEGVQNVFETHSHGHAIDGHEIFNAAAYGFAGGFGMTTGMNTRMVSADQKMFSQARLAHGLLTGGDDLSKQRWDALTDVEKRSMAALAKMDRTMLEGAYTKIAEDQAIEATADVIGVNKMADAVQTVLKQQLGKAANRTDPASVITGLEDAGKTDTDGNLLPGSMASDSVVSSGRQLAVNLMNKHRGLVDQVTGLQRKLAQANDDFAAGRIDNDDLTQRIDHYTEAIQTVELTLKWARALDPILDRHVTAMYDPAATVPEIEAEAEELNLNIRAAFNRQITTMDGVPLTELDKLALARAVSMLQTRDPQDQSGSYQVLVPQVSPKLTVQGADNVLEVSHAILPAIRGDYDGDKMRQLNQVYLDAEEYASARSGAFFIGAGGSVNVGAPKYEKYIVGEMAKALNGTGAMSSFATGTLNQIGSAIRRRYAGVVEDAVLNPLLDRFAKAVRNNDQDARKVLLDGLAEHAGTEVTEYARGNLSNEWLWVDQLVRATLQDFQEVFAAHRPVLGPGPNTDVVMPHRQSSEALKQRRVERAAVAGNTVANLFAADAPFRQAQQMHYSSLVAAVLSAEFAGSRDQLQALALLYETLGQGLTKAEIDSVRAKDEITARVYARLERISLEAQRLNPELNRVEALGVIANLSLADVTIDDEGNATPTGKEVTLAQFLLRHSIEQDRAEKDVIFESSPELQAKHAKLLGMTRPQSRTNHGDKGHRPVNAERAFLAVIGDQQLVRLLGDEANIFGPHLTGEQWVRMYTAKSEVERRQIAQKLKGEAAYLGPAAAKSIPYSLEDVGRGDVSAYRSVVDSMLAVGNNRVTIDDKGNLHGEMPKLSKEVSKKFQDFHTQSRRAVFEFMGLSHREQGEISEKTVERLLRTHPDFAARVLDLVPNAVAHTVISPDGKRIANWVYRMFTLSDAAEAEMYYWRNLLEAELNAQGVSDWNYDEEEDDGVRGRQYDRLPRRMHRIIQNLAYPENHLLLQQFILELQQATDLDEFINWVNTAPGIRGNQAPIVPWVDDVAEFDPDKAGGGWSTNLAGAELRESITNLQRGAQNLSKQLVEERMSLASDEKVIAALRRVLRAKKDPSVVLDPSDNDMFLRMQKSIDLAGDLALGLGPQAMVYQIVGAARGFYPQAHTKGVTPDYVELLGAFDALRDAYDYTTNYERVMAALTTLNIEAVGSNPSQIAKDAGRTMDEHGRPVEWEKPTVEEMLDLLENADTRPLARAMLFPQVMERTPDNKLTPQLLVGKSLKELLDGSSMKNLYPKNDRLSQDAALKYVALVESVARRDFKGHFSVQRAANDRVIARTSGADHVLTTAELEKMAVETLYEIAGELQASAGRVNQALAPGSTDPQQALLAKVREGQRMVAAAKQFPHFEGTKVTDQVLEGLILEHKNQAEAEKQGLRAQAQSDPARAAVIQQEILLIDAATERFEERVELLRADDGVDQVVTAYALPADLFDTDPVEAQRKALVLVEYVQRNTQVLGDSTSAMLVLQKLSNQLLDSGRLGEVELDPGEWELLSNSVIAVAIDEMMGATGTGISVPAYPDAEHAEDRRYFDVSFSYLARPTLDRDSVLVQAAAKIDRLAGRQGVDPVTDTEFVNLLDRGLFKEHRFGKWTADIPRASIEANQRINSAAAGDAVAMAGDPPKRQGVISAATRRTYQVPGDELMSVVSLNSVNLNQDLLDDVEVTLPGGAVVQRPLAQLNNRFARSVRLSYTDANGDQQEVDLLAEVKNLGRPFASNEGALLSGLQEIHLSRIKNAVSQVMVKRGAAPAAATVEISFAHPDSQPPAPEWMNNLFFEGTSFLLDADHHESLNSTGWFAPGSASPEFQAAALDAAKLGNPAIQVVDVPTAQDVADLETGWDSDLAGVLRAKTEKFFANDLGGITLEVSEFYNKVHKDFKLRHFVRGVDPTTNQALLWTAEQVIAHQLTGAPLADVLGTDAKLWIPSDNVLRSMLGEQGTKGVARIFEDQLDVDLAAVPSYRGVTPEMVERFAEGINGAVAGLAETNVVNRARQQVLRARPHLDPSEIAKHDLRMKRWRREEEETWIDRGEMRTKDRSEGGFSTQYGMAQAVQRGEAMLKAENVMIDWGPAGVTWVGGRAPLNTDIGKMVLNTLAAAIEADGSKMGWVFRKGQPSNPMAGLLSEVSLGGEKRPGLRVVHGDLVTVELDGFTDYDDATKWIDHFIDRGATLAIGSAAGDTDLRAEVAEYLESFDYERIAGSDHAYRPSIETRRYQNVRSRASTLTETRGVSKRNFVSLFQTRGLAVEENQAWINSTSPRLGAIKTPVNLVQVDAFGGFNVPAEQFTNESQIRAVRAHLESLSTPEGRARMLEQANSHLEGDERVQADVVFERFFDELLDRMDNGHVLPPRGDFFGKGSMIPLVNGKGQLILYRHGYPAPRVGKLRDLLKEPLDKDDPKAPPANVAVFATKPLPAASIQSGEVVAFRPRSGHGLQVELMVPLQEYGDKKVLEWNGMKYLLTPSGERLKLPDHGFFPDWGIDLVASADDMVSKEAVDGVVNSHRNAFTFLGIDFTDDVAKFFGTDTHGAREILHAFTVGVQRQSVETIDALINAGRYSTNLRTQLSEFAEAFTGKGIDPRWVDKLSDTTASVEAQIIGAMLLYLMTPGARVDHVLKSGGFNDDSADLDAQSREMPRLFTQVFDNAPIGSDLRTEINRRLNTQLHNPKTDGTGYVLHQDWTFEIINGVDAGTAQPQPTAPPVYQIKNQMVVAFVGGQPVGRMTYGAKSGEIGVLSVLPAHRRKGLATGMLEYARSQGITITHSDMRTPAGQAWAVSTGDALPEQMEFIEDEAEVVSTLVDDLKRIDPLPTTAAVSKPPAAGKNLRGFLQFAEAHSSGDNPVTNGMAFDETEKQQLSQHSAATLFQATGGDTLSARDIEKARDFATGKGIERFDSADALDGGAWRMFTNIDTRPSVPWRVETPAEAFHRRVGRDAVVHFSQPIDKLDELGWTGPQRTDYEREATKVLNALGLKPSQIGLVDKWVRQMLGQPAGKDRDNIERGHVTGKGALGAVEDILWNVRNRYLPTVGAEVSQLHAHDLQAIFRANKNKSTPWQPRTSMDGKAVNATTWDAWVRVALGSAVDSDNLFDRLFLVAQDGFMHSYQHAMDDLLDLPVSRDELTALDLMDDETNRMLTSLDPDTNILALETMVLDSYGASIDDLISGKPIAGKYRGKLPSAHEVSKRRATRRKWRAEYGIPIPVDVTMKNFRKNGGDLIDYGTSTNALFRSMIHLRVGMATLNPALYLMMGPEQWVRGSLDRAANILTGQSTTGVTGQVHAKVSQKAEGNALGTAMEAVGLESRFTPEELKALRSLYQNMGQRREFKSMIYKDLNFRRPHEQAVGRFERGLEKFSGLGMAMQDPTRGMTQRTLARRYMEGVLQHIMALPTENVVSIQRLAAGMKTDPTFLQKNFPEAHLAGTNAVAQIRSLKQTTASAWINGIINPMASSDNALYNGIGNLVFKLPLIFSGYAANVFTTLLGLQGLDQMVAAGIDGRKKLYGSFLGRVQAHLNGREFSEEDDARFDMSTVLEGVDLSRAFIRGGLTHTGLFAFGLLAGGLGLSGEDDETKKRRMMAELQGAGFVYDPRRIENDFRNSDAMFVDWLPFGWESYFRVTGEDAEGGSRSMVQLNWTLKQFISPLIGMEKFFETGDFKHVTWGFQDALGAFPLINTLMWDDAVSTAHEFAKMADDEAKLGGPTNMVQASMFLTNAVGVYERMLFENSFVNMIYASKDRYDRDPYKLPLRDSDGDIQRTIEGDARPNNLSLEQYLDPETGQIAEGYMSRDSGSATLHALTENRGTLALVSSLFTGGFDDSDYWRYNMPVKMREMGLRPTTQDEAEAVVRRLMEASGNGQPSLTADELAQIWKNQAAADDKFVNWAEVDKAAAEYVRRLEQGKPVNMAFSPVKNPLGPAPLSILDSKGKEALTKEGARAVYQGLFKGSVELGDASLAGIHITREMRLEIQKEWIHELVQDGLNLGLDQTKATSRMKRLWYGPIDNPAVLGIEDILWSDKISYSDKVQYKQLNTTYVMGPDGRPWATGFRRQGVLGALGVKPAMSAYVSEQSSTSTDSRLNTTDLVNNLNTGLRGLELINDTENIPTDKEIADSIIDAIKEVAAGDFTPFKDGTSSGGGYGGYRRYGGYGGYGGGGGYYGGGGGSSYFSKMYALPNGTTPYANGIPFINTSNPLIRRESIRRERVWSERGRLKQWQ